MDKKRIAQLHRNLSATHTLIADEFMKAVGHEPTPIPEPTPQPVPEQPTGKVELAIVFADGVQFDVWVNDELIPKSKPFDYTIRDLNHNKDVGVKLILIDQLRTFRANPNQLKVMGLNNDGFGFVSFKAVNKHGYVNREGETVGFSMNQLKGTHGAQGFWGDPAEINPLGVIWNYSGNTVIGKHKDPEFWKGVRPSLHEPRVFDPQWSATGKAVIGIFNYGINSGHPL